MEFIKAIIKPSYWLTHQHPVPEIWTTGLLIFFGLIILVGLVTIIFRFSKRFPKPWRMLSGKLTVWAWTMGLLGLLVLFFSIEQIWLISARIFYIFWLVIALWWLYYIIVYALKDLPRILQRQKERDQKEKYLPRRKK